MRNYAHFELFWLSWTYILAFFDIIWWHFFRRNENAVVRSFDRKFRETTTKQKLSSCSRFIPIYYKKVYLFRLQLELFNSIGTHIHDLIHFIIKWSGENFPIWSRGRRIFDDSKALEFVQPIHKQVVVDWQNVKIENLLMMKNFVQSTEINTQKKRKVTGSNLTEIQIVCAMIKKDRKNCLKIMKMRFH